MGLWSKLFNRRRNTCSVSVKCLECGSTLQLDGPALNPGAADEAIGIWRDAHDKFCGGFADA